MPANHSRLLIVAWIVGAASIGAGQAPLRRDAEQLKLKISTINERAAINPGVANPVRQRLTTVTEQEVNAYLTFEIAALPAGIVDPRVSMVGPERVSAKALVDLDQVRQQRSSTGLLDPVRYLRGRVLVNATGLLQTRDGVARLAFESADIAGVPIPKFLLQQIVSYYSKSAARPAGISLDGPLALPARIREIQVKPGQAIVVQ
jgi:hypothetical protein